VGASVASERVERKLVTILAADVAGYSRLTGADEEGIMRRLRALRTELIDPAIQTNRGRVFHTAGDSILIEFASVVDAVRCSVDIQRGMAVRNGDFVPEKQIEFRIGIHLGDVMVQTDGDLVGDGVNVAARLEGIAEPGGICISNSAYDQVRDKLKESFVDLGEKELKNIARPVRVFRVQVDGGTAKTPTATATPSLEPASLAPRLSIVVLPFANMGSDPEQEYFVDGVTESLTTDLSRISGSFVIGRNTAFTYKGKAVDLKQIGRELGVRYVLEGSVQRGGDRMRVNVQLIEAESGAHLWAERFDKPVADLFDMQDEIVSRLANQLRAELVAAEARRAERATNPDVMDLCFQGGAWLNKGGHPEDLARARHFYERAVELDPGNVEAMIGLAMVDHVLGGGMFSTDRAARLASAEALVTKALARAPNHAMGHYCLASIHTFTNRGAQAIAECERALALNRNLALAHGQIGVAKLTVGRGEETEAHIGEAIRLSPFDAQAYLWLSYAGFAKVFIGADEQAVAYLLQAIGTNSNFPLSYFYLAAALALLGREDEARVAVKSGLALDSGLTIQRVWAGALSNNPTYLAQRERIIEGMRTAGVPEG
jgi:TolB-like protein/class 3 adenylate cyclase